MSHLRPNCLKTSRKPIESEYCEKEKEVYSYDKTKLSPDFITEATFIRDEAIEYSKLLNSYYDTQVD